MTPATPPTIMPVPNDRHAEPGRRTRRPQPRVIHQTGPRTAEQ
jgi:hypothetical protein